MLGPEILGSKRIGDSIRVKSPSIVLDDDGDSFSCFTATTKMNRLERIETVAVNYSISARPPGLPVRYGVRHPGMAMRFFNQANQPVYQR